MFLPCPSLSCWLLFCFCFVFFLLSKEKKTLLKIFMLGKGEQTELSETDGRRVSKLVRMYWRILETGCSMWLCHPCLLTDNLGSLSSVFPHHTGKDNLGVLSSSMTPFQRNGSWALSQAKRKCEIFLLPGCYCVQRAWERLVHVH